MTERLSDRTVRELLTLFDHVLEEHGFGWDHWHPLLWNLHNVRPEDWDQAPAGGVRTIRELVLHIGAGWLSYANHLFEDGQRDWNDLEVDGISPGSSPVRWNSGCAQHIPKCETALRRSGTISWATFVLHPGVINTRFVGSSKSRSRRPSITRVKSITSGRCCRETMTGTTRIWGEKSRKCNSVPRLRPLATTTDLGFRNPACETLPPFYLSHLQKRLYPLAHVCHSP